MNEVAGKLHQDGIGEGRQQPRSKRDTSRSSDSVQCVQSSQASMCSVYELNYPLGMGNYGKGKEWISHEGLVWMHMHSS